MAALADIRAALAEALSAIPGVQSSPYALSAPTPPCFFVQPDDEADLDFTLGRGFERWPMTVTGLAGIGSGDAGAQRILDSWLATTGESSVLAALDADETLGGIAETTHASLRTGYRVYQREGGGVALGAEWNVTVYTTGAA